MMLTWSKFLANIALRKPPSENVTEVSTAAPTTISGCSTGRCVKNNATAVTATPTIAPRTTPPVTYPDTMSQLGNGETSSSSTCLPNFAPKKDDTTLVYELLITACMINPGAMYIM